MAINPTRLRPSDVVRLVNSTPVGPVLIDRQLRRHRDRAGFRVTDDGGQTVNIFKYAAWLSDIWFETEANPPQTYEDKKAAVRFKADARCRCSTPPPSASPAKPKNASGPTTRMLSMPIGPPSGVATTTSRASSARSDQAADAPQKNP
jgi:hypothetical protein